MLIPAPVVVTVPGKRVRVHVPVAGNPLNSTLPVDTLHVGPVIVPTVGVTGIPGWALIRTSEEATEVQPVELPTVNVYVPTSRPEIVFVDPVPEVVNPPGERVRVHVPAAGNPFSTTLPEDMLHVGCVIVPTVGAAGRGFTIRVNCATAAAQGTPRGLFVVAVIITVLPASPAAGVYVKLNGETVTVAGASVPVPLLVNDTLVAFPPNSFPAIVTGAVPQVFPVILLSTIDGPLTQPQETVKPVPVVVQPAAFLTVMA